MLDLEHKNKRGHQNSSNPWYFPLFVPYLVVPDLPLPHLKARQVASTGIEKMASALLYALFGNDNLGSLLKGCHPAIGPNICSSKRLHAGIRAMAHSFRGSEANPCFIKVCTGDWDVAVCTDTSAAARLRCPGLSCRWLSGTLSGWSLGGDLMEPIKPLSTTADHGIRTTEGQVGKATGAG